MTQLKKAPPHVVASDDVERHLRDLKRAYRLSHVPSCRAFSCVRRLFYSPFICCVDNSPSTDQRRIIAKHPGPGTD